jgi:predicted ATPase
MLQPVVLTGGPNAGKTTLIRAFRQMGFPVICEKATEVILEGRFMPADNPVEFRRETLARQKAAEQSLTTETRPVFIDRGAYDGRAYCKATDCVEPTFLRELGTGLYPLAFIFEPVPTWESDGVRYEDMEFSKTITPVIEDVYRDNGARVVRVPFMPVEDRVNLILSVLTERNYSREG